MNVFGAVRSLVVGVFAKTKPLLIDLGSSHTRIFIGFKEIFNEATCLAVHTDSQSVIAIGEQALKLLGKTPDSIEVSFPILSGEIAHPKYLEYYLTAVLKMAIPEVQMKRYLLGLTAKIAVPSSLSPAKKILLQQTVKAVGFTKVEFVSSGYAVARNISENDTKLKDICVLDIGAHKSEISIFSLGELIYSKSYRWGGIQLTESLQKIVRTKHHCVIGWHIAEAAKKEIGTVVASKEKIAIRGKDLMTQASKTVIIDAGDVKVDFSKILDELLDNVQQFIALLPSEVAVSVLDRGIYITGGGSQLRGIDQAVVEKFKCDVLVSTNPEKDIINGLQTI